MGGSLDTLAHLPYVSLCVWCGESHLGNGAHRGNRRQTGAQLFWGERLRSRQLGAVPRTALTVPEASRRRLSCAALPAFLLEQTALIPDKSIYFLTASSQLTFEFPWLKLAPFQILFLHYLFQVLEISKNALTNILKWLTQKRPPLVAFASLCDMNAPRSPISGSHQEHQVRDRPRCCGDVGLAFLCAHCLKAPPWPHSCAELG